MTPPTDPPDSAPTLPHVAPAGPPPEPTAPTLPTAAPIAPPPAEPQPFDARAMVDAMKRKADSPTYGDLPSATPESLEATRQLRAKARRTRRRNRLIAWAVAAIFLGGIVAAGWYGFQAYQDDQDRRAAERAAAVADVDDESGVAPEPLTPLGNQQQVIEALDDINSSDAQLSGGGLRDIVDRAQAAVDDANDVPAATTPPNATIVAPLALAEVLPDAAVAAATRLPDAEGFERYVVDTSAWTDVAGYQGWLEIMQARPQSSANSPVFDVLPPIKSGQVGIAIQRDGNQLVRALVVGTDPELHVISGG